MGNNKQIFKEGDKVGKCFYVKDVESPYLGRKRAAEFICGFCGTKFIHRMSSIKTGRVVSCGCQAINGSWSVSNYKHGGAAGGTSTPEYRAWNCMKGRCYIKTNIGYPRYGGAGIKVCDRWLHSFENFLADMGKKPTPEHTLDRYPDKKGGYGPTNCRWATRVQQIRNRSNTKMMLYKGIEKTVKEWSDELGIGYLLLKERLKRGWSPELAVSQPPNKSKKYKHIYIPAKIEYAFGHIG